MINQNYFTVIYSIAGEIRNYTFIRNQTLSRSLSFSDNNEHVGGKLFHFFTLSADSLSSS